MPETDILNPQVETGNGQFAHVCELNPDYGYQRNRPVTHQAIKPKVGPPTLRDITDVGHSFVLTWQNRPLETIRKLKRYYEQYRGGYFTYIDWEGGARHYVGHFSAPIEPIPTGHGRWGCQAQFDEVPLAPMLKYPSDWANDAVWVYAYDDWGNCQADLSLNWTSLASPLACGVREKNGLQIDPKIVRCDAHDGASWAQVGYFGYGFQFWSQRGPNMGKVSILFNGAPVVPEIDLYAAQATASSPVYTNASIPLGLYSAGILVGADKNAASSDYVVYFEGMRVMR